MAVEYQKYTSVKIAVVTLTSDSGGDVAQGIEVDGQLIKVVTNPDGDDAPDADWDLTLVDDDGLDVAQGLLADRHTSNSEEVYLFEEVTLGGTGTDAAALPIYHSGTLTVTGDNMGATKTAVVKVFYR
jgi:hypothetical protein